MKMVRERNMTNHPYFTLDENSYANLTRKPNITLDIPKEGYNWQATNYVASKIAQANEDCSFLDTGEYVLLGSEDGEKADNYLIDMCCNGRQMITGEVDIAPKENNYSLLTNILNIASQTLARKDIEVDQHRLVVPLTIVSEGKEAHGVALCIDSQKEKNHVDIMILEQHAQRDTKDANYIEKLDYSEEIDKTLSYIKRFFTALDVEADTFQNDKPICRRKGVCGIVSAEVCKRLLEAENPMKKAKLGTIKIKDEQVDEYHHQNFLNYQKDNPPSKTLMQNKDFER